MIVADRSADRSVGWRNIRRSERRLRHLRKGSSYEGRTSPLQLAQPRGFSPSLTGWTK